MNAILAWHDWPAPIKGERSRYAAMFDWQAGRCAICGDEARLILDHCHVLHKTRGYLCQSCNVREGKTPNVEPFVAWRLGDNPATAYGWTEEMWGASELIEAFYLDLNPDRDEVMRRGAEAAGRIG
jgi:hypothetical protein